MTPIGAGRPSPWLRSRPWAVAAVLGAALLLGTLSIAPGVWLNDILPRLQPHVTRWYVGAGVLIAASLAAWAWWAGERRRPAAIGVLAAAFLGYVLLLFVYYRGEAPAKKFHLIEYGLLAGVTLQAVAVEEGEWAGPVAAALFLVVVGTADEVSQKFIPMRTFRWLDLFANYIGSGLGAVAWLAASHHSPWRRSPAA